MDNINKIISVKMKKLNSSNETFHDMFEIMHDLEDNVFSEITDGYKIKKVTYKECKEKCINTGKYLQRDLSDIPKGSFIGLLMDNSLDWIAIFWGLLMAGYKPMLLNKRLGYKLNQEVIDMLNIPVIYADCDMQLTSQIRKISVDNIEKIKEDVEFTWADEIALSTSATSLNVKVCVYDGKAIVEQVKNTRNIVKENTMIKKHYKGSLKIITFLPFYHIFGLVATYFWFACFGRTFVFLKDFSTDTILKTIRKHSVTHIFAVPMLWHGIYKEVMKQIASTNEKTQAKFKKGIKISLALQNVFPIFGKKIAGKMFKEVQDKLFGDSVQFMISGGSYISNNALELINAIGYPLYNGYGMSEIGIASVELRKKMKYRLQGTIGKPFASIDYKISDNGCLLVKGNSLCKKIISKEQVVIIDKQEWFNTTDTASVDKKGYYMINGRMDDVVVGSNGEKVNPDVIEKLVFLPNAKRHVIVGIKQNEQTFLSLVVEVNKGLNSIKKNKLILEIENTINVLKKENFIIEKVFITYDSIASEAAIKVSRSILLKLLSKGDVILHDYSELKKTVVNNDEAIVSELERDVIKVMADLLNKNDDEIAPNSHFIYDLGGTSLDYLTLLVKLKEVFEMDFSADVDNCFYSASEFANYIVEKNK